MTMISSLFIVAAIASCALGVAALARAPRNGFRCSFAIGMVGFAVEALSAFALVTQSETPAEHVLWLKTTLIAGLLLLIPWAFFIVTLARPRESRLSRRVWLALAAGSVVTVGGSVAIAVLPVFEVADFTGPFYAARIQ